VTPHVAGVTDAIGSRVLRFFEQNLVRYLNGELLANTVARWQWDEQPMAIA
jgi:phosphoglycerate dehydrogenase-like enzyme